MEINPTYLVALQFFLTCGGYLYICVATLIGTAKSKMRREYLSVGICLVLFSFFYGLMTIAENQTLLRVFWAAGFFFGCLFYPAWIRFLSNMVVFKLKITKHLIKVSLGLTALVS